MTSRTVVHFWKNLWFAGGKPQRNAPVPKQSQRVLGAHSAAIFSRSHTFGVRYALPSRAASNAIRIYMPLRIWRK